MGAIATIAAVAGLDGRCRLPYCFFFFFFFFFRRVLN